jgi:hypothetical protein
MENGTIESDKKNETGGATETKEPEKTRESGEQKNDNKKKVEFLVMAAVSLIAAAVLAGAVVYYFQTKSIEQIKMDYEQRLRASESRRPPQPAQPLPVSTPVVVENEQSVEESRLQIGLDKIHVNWEKEMVEVKENCAETEETRCFRVGKVANDDPKYKGKDFYLEASSTMGGWDIKHYVIEKRADGKDAKAYAEPENGEEGGAAIAGITDIPETITFPGTSHHLKKHYLPSFLYSEVNTKRKVFYDNKIGDFYLTEEGCVVAELPDHTAIAYDFDFPFVSDEDRVPKITFNDGSKNKDEYEYTKPSCGALCFPLSIVEADELKPDDRLEIAGKMSNGENVYRYKNRNDQALLDLYNDENTLAYYSDDYEQRGENKYTYDEFIKANPFLFWKDPLGRWVEFLNMKFTTAAEMCKPVVYLYPEKKTDLELTLDIKGVLKHTDPTYGSGWKVEASPDGKIKDLVSGENKDYLLWEGIGLDYPRQNEGWVVKKENLDSFFSEKLALLGLNGKESGDFKEYWLARLNEKPYYKISFLSRGQFDSLARLQFNPESPDIFIRVMMTAEGRDNFENIPEQKLPVAPERKGFTAIEWGGALLK